MIEPSQWRPIGVGDLEPAAMEVVRSRKNMSVVAGPGSGKTELLAQRACYLLQTGIVPSPRRILAISFKRDAAKNLQDRVSQRCEPQDAARLDSFTFDAFAKSLLDRFYPALPDPWRPTADYEILFPTTHTFPDFLDGLNDPPPEVATLNQVREIPQKTFEKIEVLGAPLPDENLAVENARTWAAAKWWTESLHGNGRSSLTFSMIGRLVDLLIRTNPKILKALRFTYSHVFLDEFQDTTHVQYDLVKSIFLESSSILTAVGDNKQRIMRFAMALDDAFGCFENDFVATRTRLVNNYRSSPELVRIQHQIALAVDPDSEEAASRVNGESSDDSCMILEFDTVEEEAQYLGHLIGTAVNTGALAPSDFAILVKQKAVDYAGDLQPIFLQSSVRLRDDGSLQDLMAERFTAVLVSFLRYGALKRAGIHWTKCAGIVLSLWGSDPGNDIEAQKLHEDLGRFHSALHGRMKELPTSSSPLRATIDMIIGFLGEDNIKAAYPEYQQGSWYKQVKDDVVKHLFKRCEENPDWLTTLDDFEGNNSVPLLTIHKSKGLEYHTVIFFALDDKAWWTFRTDPAETRSAFFVAFSRAKQKVIFTYCKERGMRTNIASLYETLASAGVPIRKATQT